MASYPLEPTIESFGAKLLASGDLDPLYIALHGADLPDEQLKRWMFAYWCCYHAGASCFISERSGDKFWNAMHWMTVNTVSPPAPLPPRWPRGHERRHFRGEKAIAAIDLLSRAHPQVEHLVYWIASAAPSFRAVRERVMTMPQFGPWIAFKIADMLERLQGVSIDFDNADVLMFKSPYDAALLVAQQWSENQGTIPPADYDRFVQMTANDLIDTFERFFAPPRYDRLVNIQEVETILCKWKSHLSGHYPLGLDTREIRAGLLEWSTVSETAARILQSLPK